jgi:hypothetical protein
MNLANKTFRNNKTGESVKVIDSFENIAVLENKQRIDTSVLLDTNQYTEQIDPNSFFNNQGAYNILAEKIKSLPTDSLVDDSLVEQFGAEVRPAINESAVVMTTEEDEVAELARKYGVNMDNNDAVAKQQAAFSKYLDEEELAQMPPLPQPTKQPVQQVEASREYIQPPVQRVQADDPITQMFRNVKRNVEFKMNIEVSNKIPRLDFIEMMEDSYEISIIDFLAEEFTNNILKDPSQLKESIKMRIKQQVYGTIQAEGRINRKVVKDISFNEETGEIKVEKPKRGRKPAAPKMDKVVKEGQQTEKLNSKK